MTSPSPSSESLTPAAAFRRAAALRAQGDLPHAAEVCRRILDRDPDHADALHLLGVIDFQAGRLTEAVRRIGRAIRLRPKRSDFYSNLGNVLKKRGRLKASLAAFKRAKTLNPESPDILNNMGVTLYELGRLDEAIAAYEAAISLRPDYAEAYNNLCVPLKDKGRHGAVLSCCRKAVELSPRNAGAHSNLGNALSNLGRISEAVSAYERAIDLNPRFAGAYNNLGNALKDRGRVDEAIDAYRRALSVNPDDRNAHDNLILTMHYSPNESAGTLRAERQRWNARFAEPHRAGIRPHQNDRRPDRRLRIGFVSSDFGRHPVGYFLAPYLACHRREAVEVICYSDRKQDDSLTVQLRRMADGWRQTVGLSDDRLARAIREDRIDILVDLSGHTAGNRLLTFARKPAPVQAVWIAYPDTTGMAVMDYLITDGRVTPPGAEKDFSERLARLPETYVCYAPPDRAPAVTPLPALDAGGITFGCLNNIAKMTPEMVSIWSRILRRVPESRLILKYKSFGDDSVRQRYRRLFADAGIDPARVVMRGFSPTHREHLETYQEIDIALDPFPYNGTTSTCEALYMGVPVVGSAGTTFVGRQGVSLLHTVGLSDWIAGDEEGYVGMAVRRAGDLEALAALRRSLRERMRQSPLCNAARFSRFLETAFRRMWGQYLGRTDPNRLIKAAVTAHRSGDPDRAERLYRRILETTPDHPDALHLLGVVCCQSDRLEEGAELIERAIAVQPNQAAFHSSLGNARKGLGQLNAARAGYERAIALNPDFSEGHYNLANLLKADGRMDEAIDHFRAALKINPDSVAVWNNLANALREKGEMAEAIRCYREAVHRKPDYAEALANLGSALKTNGEVEAAERCLRDALTRLPEVPRLHHHLGNLLRERGDLDGAAGHLEKALSLAPDDSLIHSGLGFLRSDQGRRDESLAAFRRAVELKPDDHAAHMNLGNALMERRSAGEAMACFNQALDLKPHSHETLTNRGNLFKELGEAEKAVDSYQQALALNPEFRAAFENQLLAMHCLPDLSPEAIRRAHDEWNSRFAAPLADPAAQHDNDPSPDRRLRVGIVSMDFGQHPVGYILLPFFEAHDPEAISLFCYTDRRREDPVTGRLKARAAAWRPIAGLSDRRVAEMVRSDRIDILVDMSGHTAGNRLLVFARKPAPIEVSWAAYPDTTGMTAVDYIIADRWVIPDGAEAGFAETPRRLPVSYLCWEPPAHAPPVGPLPALERGYLTFGCTNNLAKVTKTVIALWAEILKAVPDAHLLMKNRYLEDPEVADRFRSRFVDAGVDPDRIELMGYTPNHTAHLSAYGRIDVGLDPFPYNGTTTTCETLYMGVPVISLAGRTFVARQGVSILNTVGLPDWVAASESDYVERAVASGADLDALAKLRAGLRDRMATSPLCNGPRFARDIERAFREMWRRWCASQTTERQGHGEKTSAES